MGKRQSRAAILTVRVAARLSLRAALHRAVSGGPSRPVVPIRIS
jgi:hypothetical protein